MGSATSEIAVFSLKIERGKLDRLKEIASSHERSAAQQLRWMVDRAIEDHDERAKAS